MWMIFCCSCPIYHAPCLQPFSVLDALKFVAKDYSFKDLSFKISNSGFVYLEMHVADTLVNLYQKNFLSLLTQIKHDFERWSLLNLSVAAGISTIKMNIFPRFLYLFQCVTIFPPLAFLQ